MAIQLYRSGNTHTVRGIECELANVSITSMETMLKSGWYTSPEDIGNDGQEEKGNDQEDEQANQETQEGEEAEKVLNPIRVKARDAGIDGWDTKRIATLETLLES